jgi:tRNA pseudouridine55 synthase
LGFFNFRFIPFALIVSLDLEINCQVPNMTQIRRSPAPWGWIVVDKNSDATSMHVTHRIKRIFDIKKAGHAGTLDPLASGILPVALGLATPLIPWAMGFSKTYTFTIAWGTFTSTDDRCGAVQKTCPNRPTLKQLQALLPRFTGEILQVPPVYCAAKIQGMPAYARARQGEEVHLLPRKVTIHRLEILEHTGDETHLRMDCGTGTYVRSIARDMAVALGLCGCIQALRRVRVGPFNQGILLGDLEQSSPEELSTKLLPPQHVLEGVFTYVVDAQEKEALWNGKKIPFYLSNPLTQTAIACYDGLGCLVALANSCQGWLAPTRCFIGKI